MGRGIFRHARLAWLLGFRSRAFRSLAVIGILLLFAAWLSGAFSLRQPAVVAMDIGLSGLRFLGTFFVLYWIQEIFVKDIERRTICTALAYPVSRTDYVLGRWLGATALVAMMVLVWAIGLAILSRVSDWGYAGSVRPDVGLGFALTLLGIFVDLLVVAMFAVWLASFAQTPMVPFLGGAGFAVAARLLGPSMDYLLFSGDADKATSAALLPVFEAVRWVIPDLSLLDWRTAVLYKQWPAAGDVVHSVSFAAGYLTLFAVLATNNYRRREFS